jgi:hypothetical protein
MRLPPTEAIYTAVNGCQLMAKYLEHLNTEAFIRREARARGVSVARFRRLLKEGDRLSG